MNCSDFKQMLDLYIDGELNEDQRKSLEAHAAHCSSCRNELTASEQLRDILSHMDDNIAVPLPAQAAWRSAVRAEAKRIRLKKVYAVCGTVAAVCMLTVGVTAMLDRKPELSLSVIEQTPRVESDGVSQHAGSGSEATAASFGIRRLDYISRIIEAEDPVQAYDYLSDVIAEYGASVERESEGDERKIFVQVPGDSAVDFINAVDSLGTVLSDDAVVVDESAVSVGFCITICGM